MRLMALLAAPLAFFAIFLFLARSAPAEPITTVVEAESMTPNAPSLVSFTSRADASGGRAALLKLPWAKVVASRDTKRISKVSVRAGTYIECSGTIRMQVRVDGTTRIDKQLNNRYDWSWHSADVDIPAGRHTVEVAFISGPSCYKELWVDRVDLSQDQPAPQPIALGVWTQHVPWDLTKLYDYQNKAGRKPAMVLWFQSWGPAGEAVFCKSCAQNLQSQGYKQVVTWMPQDYHYGANQPSYNLDSIISGRHDAYIRQYADAIKASGANIYLRPMHEMNGDWYPWGDGVNGNTPDKYKKAWIRMHDLFKQRGVTNVKWVWAPNVSQPGWTPAHSMSSFYPGDAYVDWVALDGYNWSTVHNDPWRSFDELYSRSYSEITSLAPTKPLMVAETSSEELGGDKGQWVNNLQAVVKTKYPKIRALIWFNQHTDGANWPINSSQKSLDAFRQLAADPYFQGSMP